MTGAVVVLMLVIGLLLVDRERERLRGIADCERVEALYRRAMDAIVAAQTIGTTERREATVTPPAEERELLPTDERLVRRMDAATLAAGMARIKSLYAEQGVVISDEDAAAEATALFHGRTPPIPAGLEILAN